MKKTKKAKRERKPRKNLKLLELFRTRSFGWLWPIAGLVVIVTTSWLINVSSGHWSKKVTERVSEQAGLDIQLVKVGVKGRDVELSGRVPSDELRAQIARAVKGVYGVRNVQSALIVVAPKLVEAAPKNVTRTITAPSVNDYAGNNRRPIVKGSWPHETGGKLEVLLDGQTYLAGVDRELRLAGGHFELTPRSDLADGVYEVEVRVHVDGADILDKTRNEIVIDATAPAAPTVGISAGGSFVPVVRGVWDRKDGSGLAILLAGKTYRLGDSPFLVSDSVGNWTLALEKPLQTGVYDVVVTTTDKFGNRSTDISENELVIGNVASAVPAHPLQEGELRPVAAGRWAEGRGRNLEVVLNGYTYRLGQDDALTSDGKGNWLLKPGLGLDDGDYSLIVRVVDEVGPGGVFTTTRKISVDNTSPAAPHVAPYSGFKSPDTITGTWDEREAVGLEVAVDGEKYTLGKDENLYVIDSGLWKLELAEPLRAGTYDVVVSNFDAVGNVSRDQTNAEIVIKVPGQVPLPAWYAIKKRDQVILQGTVPENVVNANLISRIQKAAPDVIIDDLGVAGDEPAVEGWFDAVSLALDQLVKFRDGSVRIENGVLTITGNAVDDASVEQAKQKITSALPDGYSASFALTANQGPDAATCQQNFDTVLGTEDILFSNGSAEFADASQGVIEKLSELAGECHNFLIEISAHTDSNGPFAANMQLSRKRAKSIAKFLTSRHPNKLNLKTSGFGESRPLMSNKTELGRKTNRRIEITVIQ